MKLTIEETAELIRLAPITVRAYAHRLGFGSREGRRKYFTKAETKQIGSGKLPKPAQKKPVVKSRARATTTKAKRR